MNLTTENQGGNIHVQLQGPPRISGTVHAIIDPSGNIYLDGLVTPDEATELCKMARAHGASPKDARGQPMVPGQCYSVWLDDGETFTPQWLTTWQEGQEQAPNHVYVRTDPPKRKG